MNHISPLFYHFEKGINELDIRLSEKIHRLGLKDQNLAIPFNRAKRILLSLQNIRMLYCSQKVKLNENDLIDLFVIANLTTKSLPLSSHHPIYGESPLLTSYEVEKLEFVVQRIKKNRVPKDGLKLALEVLWELSISCICFGIPLIMSSPIILILFSCSYLLYYAFFPTETLFHGKAFFKEIATDVNKIIQSEACNEDALCDPEHSIATKINHSLNHFFSKSKKEKKENTLTDMFANELRLPYPMT